MESGVPADKWRRAVWQPGKRRWAYYTEEEERAILAAEAAGPLSQENPDDRNSARFECERLQRAVDKARAAGREVEGYQRDMRGAVIRSYERAVRRLAAESLLAP